MGIIIGNGDAGYRPGIASTKGDDALHAAKTFVAIGDDAGDRKRIARFVPYLQAIGMQLLCVGQTAAIVPEFDILARNQINAVGIRIRKAIALNNDETAVQQADAGVAVISVRAIEEFQVIRADDLDCYEPRARKCAALDRPVAGADKPHARYRRIGQVERHGTCRARLYDDGR